MRWFVPVMRRAISRTPPRVATRPSRLLCIGPEDDGLSHREPVPDGVQVLP